MKTLRMKTKSNRAQETASVVCICPHAFINMSTCFHSMCPHDHTHMSLYAVFVDEDGENEDLFDNSKSPITLQTCMTKCEQRPGCFLFAYGETTPKKCQWQKTLGRGYCFSPSTSLSNVAMYRLKASAFLLMPTFALAADRI